MNLYEKYLILIHRRFKWKGKPSGNQLRYKSTDDIDGCTKGSIESCRRRKRKVSQNDDITDSPTSKTRIIHPNAMKGNIIIRLKSKKILVINIFKLYLFLENNLYDSYF